MRPKARGRGDQPAEVAVELQRQVRQAVALVALLLTVVFLLGFTVGRWVEHGR